MLDRRRLTVLTTGRQDYGILRSSLHALACDPRFELRIWAGGMHLSKAHGRTVAQIDEDGLEVAREIEILEGSDDVAMHAARTLVEVARAIDAERPDALMLVGDRLETHAAAVAATLRAVPIVHLHGGEETEGAIDNALRHAITKLAHLHLVSHEHHARRVIQMGEAPESVVIVGAPGLDNLFRSDLPSRTELERRLGIPLIPPVVVVTLHPATLAEGDPVHEVRALCAAMERIEATWVVTQPNADAGGCAIREQWLRWSRGRSRIALVDALGERAYFGLLRVADAVAGNSSSGLIEAPALGLPVVNIGDRQRGRLRSAHVTDVPPEEVAIEHAIRQAISPERRRELEREEPPYLRGPAAPRIVEAIARWVPPRPPRKQFVDR